MAHEERDQEKTSDSTVRRDSTHLMGEECASACLRVCTADCIFGHLCVCMCVCAVYVRVSVYFTSRLGNSLRRWRTN